MLNGIKNALRFDLAIPSDFIQYGLQYIPLLAVCFFLSISREGLLRTTGDWNETVRGASLFPHYPYAFVFEGLTIFRPKEKRPTSLLAILK